MKMITKAIEARLAKAPLYSGDGQDLAPVIVKFFTPDSNWTWFVLEAGSDGDDWRFFGLVDGHEKELGYFTLSELQSAKGPLGLRIERDLYFDGYSVKKSTNEVLRIAVQPVKYKVMVKPVGETELCGNGMVFDTREAAQTWGDGLLSRWTGAERFEVHEVAAVIS
jgi:Protein of unknown function (DUF2958)